jgi:hypothetical protein
MSDNRDEREGASERRATAHTIAQALGEQANGPRVQITRIVNVLGVDQALAMLEETRRIEEGGGMLLPNRSRRRTIGGVFFYLARQRIPEDQHEQVFGRRKQKRAPEGSARTPPPPPPSPPFRWEDRHAVLGLFSPADYGEARSMDNKLICRPTRVEIRGETAITVVRLPPAPQNFPKGVPTPRAHAGLCTVYMSAKQWRKVEAVHRATPDDRLIIEGWLVWDDERKEYALSARSVKSIAVERSRSAQASTQS